MNNLKNLINNKIIKSDKLSYALIIGLNPSQGAKSPKLWNKFYIKKKIKCKMYPADVSAKNLKNLMNKLRSDKYFIGGSVTTPYKIEIMKYLDTIDDNAKKIGSINTIVKIGKRLKGYNTDYFGASSTLSKINLKKNILILGSGGASKAVTIATFNKFKKSNFYFFNRTKSKLIFFKKSLTFKKIKILKKITDAFLIKDLDFIINTTSLGFDSWIKKNNKYYNLIFFSPLNKINKIKFTKSKNITEFKNKNLNLITKDNLTLEKFFSSNNKIEVFDIIYKPKETKILKYAKKYGNKIYNGLEMNLMQAVKGFALTNKIKNINNVKKIMKTNG